MKLIATYGGPLRLAPKPVKKIVRPRDSMRQRAYDWENDVLSVHWAPMMTKAETEAYVANIWAYAKAAWREHFGAELRAPVPPMRFRRGSSAAASWGHSLIFGNQACTRPIVCHEVAHLLAMQDSIRATGEKISYPAHGAQWLGWYVELLYRAKLCRLNAVIRSTSFYRLGIVPKGKIVAAELKDQRVTPASE